MTALTGEELLAWVERTAEGWRELVTQHPEALALPCDVRETQNVAELLQHIVAVELRYTQRLHGVRESAYEEIAHGSGEELYATHRKAATMLRELFRDKSDGWWDESIKSVTRSAGVLLAKRRTVLVHLLMH